MANAWSCFAFCINNKAKRNGRHAKFNWTIKSFNISAKDGAQNGWGRVDGCSVVLMKTVKTILLRWRFELKISLLMFLWINLRFYWTNENMYLQKILEKFCNKALLIEFFQNNFIQKQFLNHLCRISLGIIAQSLFQALRRLPFHLHFDMKKQSKDASRSGL